MFTQEMKQGKFDSGIKKPRHHFKVSDMTSPVVFSNITSKMDQNQIKTGRKESAMSVIQREHLMNQTVQPKQAKSKFNTNNRGSLKQLHTQAREVHPFSADDDKTMRDIIDVYRKVMNSNDQSKENLLLKKIRLNHPWLRKMSFNSFKMIFDNCQMVQIRWGQKLYK